MKNSEHEQTDAFNHAVTLLNSANRVVVFTGAGLSAESGVPTFRDGLTGCWAQFDPWSWQRRRPLLLILSAFWHGMPRCRAAVKKCEPHDGYSALMSLASRKRVTVITQNVDRLHQSAGHNDVIELHGNLLEERCNRCQRVDPSEPELKPPYQRY